MNGQSTASVIGQGSRAVSGSVGPDMVLFMAVMGLLLVGSLVVLSASARFTHGTGDSYPALYLRHVSWIGVGLCFMFGAMYVPVKWVKRLALPGLVLSTILVGISVFSGHPVLGATRWITVNGVSFQPSELLKITFVLALVGVIFGESQGWARRLCVALFGVATLCSVCLLFKQPDLGTVATLAVTALAILLVAGMSRRLMLGMGGFLGIVFSVLVSLRPEWLGRVLNWLQSSCRGDGYQQCNAVAAIAHAGMWGAGLGHGMLHFTQYLPQAESDFVFAVIVEEGGFILGACVVLLYAAIFLSGMRIYARAASPQSQYMALGLTLLLTVQAVMHMFVTLKLGPTKGLVLPFVSYGGSAMVMGLTTVGLLERLHMEACLEAEEEWAH